MFGKGTGKGEDGGRSARIIMPMEAKDLLLFCSVTWGRWLAAGSLQGVSGHMSCQKSIMPYKLLVLEVAFHLILNPG